MEVRVRRERKEAHFAVQDVFRFARHLAFGDPERGLCDGAGEVLDFDAVELADRDADKSRIVRLVEVEREDARAAFAHDGLAQDVVFEPAEREVRLGQEIARAARGVEIFSLAERFLERAQFLRPRFEVFFVHRNAELVAIIIEEQRIDHIVYVFQARVVHAAVAAGLGVQRAFEDGAKNGRRNAAPVEAATLGEDELARRRVDGRDGDGLGEEAAVDIGERGELGLHEFIAVFDLLIEHAKELDERRAEVLRTERVEVVMKLVAASENTGVLGVEAEDEAHDELVEVLEVFRGRGVAVARQEGVIDFADERAGLAREVELALDVGVSHVDHEAEAVVFFREVF